MSDFAQGEGWWQASDGKWYAPERHPDYHPPPPFPSSAPSPPTAPATYAAAPGYPPVPGGTVDHPQGTTVLILGILSLVVCGLLGPVAWYMGNNALAEIDRDRNRYSNRGNVVAGRICGIVATVLIILGVLFFIVILIAAAGSSVD